MLCQAKGRQILDTPLRRPFFRSALTPIVPWISEALDWRRPALADGEPGPISRDGSTHAA